ncbi:MAG: putative transport system permease protein, partial [Acidimicrobiaceae bacterium]|nr:putative transport system permease protein [Acidimicrobiaceae bacterium]
RARIGVVTTTVAKTNEAASSLLPLATSLGYFKALGLLGGTVTLCGAVFYLASRERARRLAGVMARGMGLTRGTARTALALELAGLLLVGLGLGWALSTWAARVAFPHLDPSPGTPPSLLFRWDLWAPVDAAAVTVVAATALAWVSERASSRRLAAEVMRDA